MKIILDGATRLLLDEPSLLSRGRRTDGAASLDSADLSSSTQSGEDVAAKIRAAYPDAAPKEEPAEQRVRYELTAMTEHLNRTTDYGRLDSTGKRFDLNNPYEYRQYFTNNLLISYSADDALMPKGIWSDEVCRKWREDVAEVQRTVSNTIVSPNLTPREGDPPDMTNTVFTIGSRLSRSFPNERAVHYFEHWTKLWRTGLVAHEVKTKERFKSYQEGARAISKLFALRLRHAPHRHHDVVPDAGGWLDFASVRDAVMYKERRDQNVRNLLSWFRSFELKEIIYFELFIVFALSMIVDRDVKTRYQIWVYYPELSRDRLMIVGMRAMTGHSMSWMDPARLLTKDTMGVMKDVVRGIFHVTTLVRLTSIFKNNLLPG